MQRRDFISTMGLGLGATIGLGLLGATPSFAAEKAGGVAPAAGLAGVPKSLLEAALDCVKTGNICLAHCERELATGNTSLADCQKNVMNVVAVCESLSKVAAFNNADVGHLKAFVKACSAICEDCAKACEKHASHHAECKACYDSCKACSAACDKYTA
jgi:Cys-rich four helix bundle protein (predicted Tat secretion target)